MSVHVHCDDESCKVTACQNARAAIRDEIDEPRKWQAFAADDERPLAVNRPCPCGCDQRGGPNGVGYLHGIKNGHGFTVWLKTEEEYQTARGLFGGDR